MLNTLRYLVVLCLLAVFYIDSSDAETVSADSLNQVAYLAFHRQEFRLCEKMAREAWSQAGGTGLQSAIAAANVAAALTIRGHFDEATEWQTRAAALVGPELPSVSGRLKVARAMTEYLKTRQYSAGEAEEALQELEKAALTLPPGDFSLLSVQAEILVRSNQGPRSQEGYARYRAMLDSCRSWNDLGLTARYASRMGRVEGTTGGHQAALDLYKESLKAHRGKANTPGIAHSIRNIGLARRNLQQYEQSGDAFRYALDLADRVKDQRLKVIIWNDLTVLYTEIGHHSGALEADIEANTALRVFAADLAQGKLEQNVLTDFHELLKMRFTNRLPYLTELFGGFYDQLALEP